MPDILIANDDKPSREIFKELLIMGFPDSFIGLAQDGREAKELLENIAFDAVICDVQMPKMDGFELYDSLSHPPAFIMTSCSRKYEKEAEKRNIAFLAVPCTRKELCDKVRAYLG